MNTIVVIAERQDEFTLFSSNFSHLPVHFSWNKTMQTAMDNLALEQPFILFTVSKNLEQLMEWLSAYDASKFQIPLVAFTGSLDWANREMLWKIGVSDIVELPRGRKELEYIIRAFLIHPQAQEIDTVNQMQGQLQDLNVVDLIRSFASGAKSGILLLEKEATKGQLEFNKGQLVNASLAECDPLEAILVMSLWKKGRFVGRFDQGKHKERILLDNAQVVMECQNYEASYNEYIKKLPDWNSTLYTDPDLEYQEFGPKDREILQKFRDGLTIFQFMNGYEGNWNSILKKFLLWLDRKWILQDDAYHLLQAKQVADQRKSGMRKAFDRMFSKKEEDLFLTEMEGNSSADEDDLSIIDSKQQYLFNQEEQLLSFADVPEGILEIPLISIDDQELDLLMKKEDFKPVSDLTDLTYYEHKFSDKKSLILYCITNFYNNPDFAHYDRLINKVPFLFILFCRESAIVQTIIRRLEQRYQTPIIFLSSKAVAEEVSIVEDKNLQDISEDNLILFNSLDENKVEQALSDAIALYLKQKTGQ